MALRRCRALRSIASSIDESCAVDFHQKWMDAALGKIMRDGAGELEQAVASVAVDPKAAAQAGTEAGVFDGSVAAEIGPCDDFHGKWMHRLHQKVVRTVDPVLATRISGMQDEAVPFLAYPATNSGLNAPVPLVSSFAQDLPDVLHMWRPLNGGKAARTTFRIGSTSHLRRRSAWLNSKETGHHTTHTVLPKAGKAPWKLPAHYNTMPIPSMHIGGLGFSLVNPTIPHNLRLMLINDKGRPEEEGGAPGGEEAGPAPTA